MYERRKQFIAEHVDGAFFSRPATCPSLPGPSKLGFRNPQPDQGIKRVSMEMQQHLEQIFDAVHDYVIFGPAQSLHIDGHDLGPDTAQQEIVLAVILWRTLIGPHSLRLAGMHLPHHSSVMRQGPINTLYPHRDISAEHCTQYT